MAFGFDGPNGVAIKPTYGAAGAPKWFTGGDPTGSPPVDASNPGADWFNMVTGEMLAVLTAAGVSPDKANDAQIAAALVAMFGATPLAYVTAGATTVTAPAWAHRLEWEGWGGGGGGGGGGASGCGSGGGGGTWGRGVLAVTPGGSVTFTVGAAGSGGAASGNGTDGGATTITGAGITSANTITLPGGGKGLGGAGAPQATAGAAGAAATVNTGDASKRGSSGLTGYSVGDNLAAPGGGWSFGGTLGGAVVTNAALTGGAGLSYGCGGSAGANGASGGAGHAGAIFARWRP
jgi:hypothetical protein